jgi:isocitrate dehydrogenase
MELQSLNPGRTVALVGFEFDDDAVHTIELVGIGHDFARVILKDFETEIYRQQPGSQVISIVSIRKPEFESKLKRNSPNETTAILVSVRVQFPLTSIIRSPDGTLWQLLADVIYHQRDMDKPERPLPHTYQYSLNINQATKVPAN